MIAEFKHSSVGENIPLQIGESAFTPNQGHSPKLRQLAAAGAQLGEGDVSMGHFDHTHAR